MFLVWDKLFSANAFDSFFRAGPSQEAKQRKSYPFSQILSDKAIKWLGSFKVTCILFFFSLSKSPLNIDSTQIQKCYKLENRCVQFAFVLLWNMSLKCY